MKRPNPSFWAGKRVLLTGQTGFKGAWTALWLNRMGATVVGLALPPEGQPNLFDLAEVASHIDHQVVQLGDREAVRANLAERELDIVIHMAAQAFVRASIVDPIRTFSTNVMGTAHLLDALRDHSDLQAVLTITSDKVYSNAEAGRRFTESDPLGGKDPYSASKAATEFVVSSFARSFFDPVNIPVATARGGNVIGGGDYSPDRLVADVVRASMSDEVTILRHPEATRPWQHVLDCIAGYLVFAEHLAIAPNTPRAMNFGPSPGATPVTVGDLATRLTSGLGAKPWRHEPDQASIEAQTLGVDTHLASETLGFQSRLDIPSAVDWTVEWHRRHAEGVPALTLCKQQIHRYEELE